MQQRIFNEDKNKYYAASAALPGISLYFKAKLFEFFDYDIEAFWKCDSPDLKEFSLKNPDVCVSRTFLSAKSKINPELEYKNALEKGYKILGYEDENYPELLKQIPDFPLMLYYKGSFEGINLKRTLAIVGSRKASENAKESLAKIISQMQNTDVTIVSGLAYGIDAKAHESAIKNGLKTIGVIGSGLDFEYPSSNKNLYRRIEEGSGVVISEFAPSIAPVARNFPQRNRIVTGLCSGTLVAEAALKSGAMISANLTLEQNRELMCMPGLISNPNCEGIYHLIKNGASIVTCANDIFECLNWALEQNDKKIKLEGVEKNIFDTIQIEPLGFDSLCSKLNIPSNELMVCLTGMELKGLIKQIDTKYYISN